VRVGLLSDVHANLQALESVLAQIDANADADALWARLRERGAVLVQGNHDRAVATGEGLDWFHDRAAVAARLHTKWLSSEERDHLGALPLTATIERFTLCHGSVRDPLWEYVTTARGAAASLEQAATPFACNGHTHVPALYVEERGEVRAIDVREGLPHPLASRAMLNPGSVGQPRDGDPRAAYAMLDTQAGTATFYRASYAIDEAQRRIRARGLPEMFAERLSLGL